MSESPESKDRSRPTRRDLLDKVLMAGAGIWAVGVVVPAGAYLWPARAGGPGEDWVDAGSIDDFGVGTARMVQQSGKPIIVLRLSDDDFRAFSAVCTHLGCVVVWNPATKQIDCPCHAGFFAADGSVASGPPPRALPAHRAVVVGGTLRIYT